MGQSRKEVGMRTTRNIEITDAFFHYMCGSIDFVVRPSGDRYRLRFSSNSGMLLQKWNGGTPGDPRYVTDDEIVTILGGSDTWSMESFIAMWQGWANGFAAGKEVSRTRG